MKKNFLFLFILFLVASCQKNAVSNQTASSEVKDFIWKGLNAYYLWKDKVPELYNNKFNSQEDLNLFLEKYTSPNELFESLLYERNSIDRWSWIVDDYEALEKMFEGVRKTTGMKIGLVYEPGFTNRIFAYVKYIIPQSPADKAGIKRGTVFRKVYNTYLDDQNYMVLLSSEPLKIELAQWHNNQLEDMGVIINLDKVEITENPIYLTRIIHQNNKKIGYLMYNNFISQYDSDLNNIIRSFKDEGIDDLVIDLRYNSGGSVSSMQYLASMITGQFTGQKLLIYNWHSHLQDWYQEKYPENLYRIFVEQMENNTPINSLYLHKVYIIATRSSASASESLINCLDAYIDVVHIGTYTHGKYTASITLYDSPDFSKIGINPKHKWAMQPIVLKISNVKGFSDFKNGLPPDIYKAEDYKNLGELGNPSEPLLQAALNDIQGIFPAYRNKKEVANEIFYRENQLDGMQYISTPINKEK